MSPGRINKNPDIMLVDTIQIIFYGPNRYHPLRPILSKQVVGVV